MKVLCIEDNSEKFENISRQIKFSVPDAEIENAESGNEGLRRLFLNKYDLLILDMSLPIDSFSTRKDMLYGEAILREIKRRKKEIKVIVITGFDQFETKNERLTFDELYSRLKDKYKSYLMAMIYYDQSSIEWSNTIRENLKEFQKGENKYGNIDCRRQ